MSVRQLLMVGLVIALVCGGVVWFLEDFQRRRITAGVAEEWRRFVDQLPGKEQTT